jgi:DNA replication protein DnaC
VLVNQTIDNLYALKLAEMAAGLAEQCEQPSYQALSFEERLGLLVDRELAERENRRLARHLRQAHLRAEAVIEDLDFRARRGLDRHQVLNLAECAWVRTRHNVAVVGATGLGKTFIACALANAAIRRGHSVLYLRGPRMLDELAIARADGRFQRLVASWSRVEVLVVDDYLLRPLSVEQAADVLEVIEDRAGRRSTLLTSQLPISMWHEAIGEPTLADAICDRLFEHLHRIELAGQSMRRRGNGDQGEEGTRRGARQAPGSADGPGSES